MRSRSSTPNQSTKQAGRATPPLAPHRVTPPFQGPCNGSSNVIYLPKAQETMPSLTDYGEFRRTDCILRRPQIRFRLRSDRNVNDGRSHVLEGIIKGGRTSFKNWRSIVENHRMEGTASSLYGEYETSVAKCSIVPFRRWEYAICQYKLRQNGYVRIKQRNYVN